MVFPHTYIVYLIIPFKSLRENYPFNEMLDESPLIKISRGAPKISPRYLIFFQIQFLIIPLLFPY